MTLVILVTTYIPPGGALRLEAVERTAGSWIEYLKYDGDIHVHIADDGSGPDLDVEGFWRSLVGDWATLSFSRQERQGVGASLNTGLRICHEIAPITLLTVDDWALIHPLDVTPWHQVLAKYPAVGCVMLGVSDPGMRGGQLLRWKLDTLAAATVSWERYRCYWNMKPALYHKRFFDAYGPLPERASAVDVDKIYNKHVCSSKGPTVELALLHPWRHIWSIELGDIEPGQAIPEDRLRGKVHAGVYPIPPRRVQ